MHLSVHLFTIFKLELLQKLLGLLELMNIHSIFALVDLNSQKEFQFSHHAHFKLILHQLSEGILRGIFKNLILFAEQIPLKRILIKSLITNQTET